MLPPRFNIRHKFDYFSYFSSVFSDMRVIITYLVLNYGPYFVGVGFNGQIPRFDKNQATCSSVNRLNASLYFNLSDTSRVLWVAQPGPKYAAILYHLCAISSPFPNPNLSGFYDLSKYMYLN